MRRKVNKKLLLAFIAGIVMAGVGWVYVQQQMASASPATKTVPVPARDLPRYHVITENDLTRRAVPADLVDPATALTPAEVVGKAAIATLYKGEPIRRERLSPVSALEGRRFLNVLVDLARAGGARPGDVVDVYAVTKDATGVTLGSALVAQGAVVLDVWDGQGNPLYQDAGGWAGAAARAVSANRPPAVVRLAVRPEEAARVVGGAVPGTGNVVLVVTDAEGGWATSAQ